MKRCYFAGHSKIYDKLIEKRLEESIIKLISEGIGEFAVSNYGAFDGLAASVVRKLKVNYPEIRLILVLPYLTKWVSSCVSIRTRQNQVKYPFFFVVGLEMRQAFL